MATTKRDLVKRVAESTGQAQKLTKVIVQSLFDELIGELARGHRIELRGFGVFEPVRRRPRVARNPRSGVRVEVPAKTTVHFKAGRQMRARVVDARPRPAPRRPRGTKGRS